MDKIFYLTVWKTKVYNQKQVEMGREMFKTNNLSFHHKQLEKYKQIKLKRYRREIINQWNRKQAV